MSLSIKDICYLLEEHGKQQYGMEAVSQLEHALQCAHLAESAVESDELVIACLLHDLGHLIQAEKLSAKEIDVSKDDLHQYTALPFLRSVFSPEVIEPIRLHVEAKRYLCQSETAYFDSLSQASVHSLKLQGGVFSGEQAQVFLAQPHAREAVRLRRYDDLAKEPGRAVPSLQHYVPRLERLMHPIV
jgi:phosphonate degradation associated HDIG domain protein